MSIITRSTFENNKSAEELRKAIISILRGRGDNTENLGMKSIVVAYVLYKIKLSNFDVGIRFNDIIKGVLGIDEKVLYVFKNIVTENEWSKLLKLLNDFSLEDFVIVMMISSSVFPDRSDFYETPQSIVKLSQRILDCQPNERVADIACGMGSFIVSAALDEPQALYSGYDINENCVVVSTIRAEMLKDYTNLLSRIEIQMKDIFEIDRSNKFKKIFSNYPFVIRFPIGARSDSVKKLFEKYPLRFGASDWVFNALLSELFDVEGKAVAIMTTGSLWNSTDLEIRKYFVESGLVEAVISFPERMFGFTAIKTSLIVLSHGNKNVRLIDAEELCQKGRRQNEFSADDIETIYSLLSRDSENSKLVSIEEFRKNEYVLNLQKYLLAKEIKVPYSTDFFNVIKSITRGAPCTAKELDGMVSEKATGMQYLQLNNIKNGLILYKELPNITNVPQQYEKYCLKNDSFILSKFGEPYKVAVANIKDGQKILANGNLYIIELDETRINPYYLKAFFESRKGIASLKNASAGTVFPSIGIDKLKSIKIPCPPLEEQKNIAQKYQAKQDEICVLNIRLEKAIDQLSHIFDDESEGVC